MTRAYEEIIDFIASGSTPDDVAAFVPSPEARERVWQLIERGKTDTLTAEEAAELDRSLELEHIMRLAKAKARLNLGHA